MQYLLFSRFKNQEFPIKSLTIEQRNALERFKEKIRTKEYNFESVSCLCGKSNGLLISTRDRYGLPVDTHLCNFCGTLWTSPRMTPESLKNFYTMDYRPIYVGDSQAPDLFFQEQIDHGTFIFNFTFPYLVQNNDNKKIVFDIGCGAGGNLIPFKNNGWMTFGCDLGSDYLQRGLAEGLILEHGDAVILSKYGPANFVILSHVLEHMTQPLENLRQISDLLTDDGYIYIELPGIYKIHETYGDFLLFLQNAHLYHFSLNTLVSLMNRAGFTLVTGDEYIHALFKKEKPTTNESNENFIKILAYLYGTEIYRILRINRMKYSLKKCYLWGKKKREKKL
jgi:SAM-dependent methyltransferase